MTAEIISFPVRVEDVGWHTRDGRICHYILIWPPTRYRKNRRMKLACGVQSRGTWWLDDHARHCQRCAVLAPRRLAEIAL